jgi:hypothetical protein
MFGFCAFVAASFTSTGSASQLDTWNLIDTTQTSTWVEIVT